MTSRIALRLAELGIQLPPVTAPKANYVAVRHAGSLMFVSGQVPQADGRDIHIGQVGRELTLEEGQQAARLCAINIIAQLSAALDGNLDRVTGCIRLGGFVNTAAGFGEQPQVLNGASDLIVAVFGEAGRHARAAVGVASLPRNVAVEVDAIFEVATS